MKILMEDICLVLIKDSSINESWIDIWEKSYPITSKITISPLDNIKSWQEKINNQIKHIDKENVLFFVAHSCGCNAFISWVYEQDLFTQTTKIEGAILSAPLLSIWNDSEDYILNRVRFNFKSALVFPQNDLECPKDLALKYASNLGIKAIETPYIGHLNGYLNGWQWGMRLMQDMLLA